MEGSVALDCVVRCTKKVTARQFAGLALGDAHIVRNGGGRATDDAIRSLIISTRLLGTAEWFIIHHTDCGMTYFDDHAMESLMEQGVYTALYPKLKNGTGPSSHEAKVIAYFDRAPLIRARAVRQVDGL